jgi:hypothetical protein
VPALPISGAFSAKSQPTDPGKKISNQTTPLKIFDSTEEIQLTSEFKFRVDSTYSYSSSHQTGHADLPFIFANNRTLMFSKDAKQRTVKNEGNLSQSTPRNLMLGQDTTTTCDWDALMLPLVIGPVNLGIPSDDADFSFQLPAPYQSIHIFVPSGTWVTFKRGCIVATCKFSTGFFEEMGNSNVGF